MRRLAGATARAEYELDLTGLDWPHSEASIQRMLERQRFRTESRDVVIRIDPAGPDSGQTLFQPVGRMLLQALKAGHVSHCRPLALSEGAGFYVELPSRGEDQEDA